MIKKNFIYYYRNNGIIFFRIFLFILFENKFVQRFYFFFLDFRQRLEKFFIYYELNFMFNFQNMRVRGVSKEVCLVDS